MRKTDKSKKPIILKSVSQHVEELYKKSPEFRKAYDEEVMMLKIAHKIAQLRKERHITQSGLARKIGTTQQTISRLEDFTNTRLTINTLVRLADALHAKLNIDLIPN